MQHYLEHFDRCLVDDIPNFLKIGKSVRRATTKSIRKVRVAFVGTPQRNKPNFPYKWIELYYCRTMFAGAGDYMVEFVSELLIMHIFGIQGYIALTLQTGDWVGLVN